ncbi:uncharacterized protein LOC128964763 [Oppia nitens]|uniref:uncharacterized protein LOC128964763 n=1 Tax=Oppia nitens TaxID=1686743 RepID=UPI0023DC14FD|nr:uncharacterized protein LOC128964763 [Oppia nitens]
MSEDFPEEWTPMNDDYNSVVFNSYTNGQTGAYLPVRCLPSYGNSESFPIRRTDTLKLLIVGFPSDITEIGFKSFLKRIGCKFSTFKLVTTLSGQRYSFADFETIREAQKSIELIRSQKTYKLSVCFAATEAQQEERELAINRENERLYQKNLKMKPKIDIGNCNAINSNHMNGSYRNHSDTASLSGSTEMEVLSLYAKTNKLLKVLETVADECTVCIAKPPVEHLHFIINENQVIDPKEMPALIDLGISCQTCGQKAANLKLCSQCKRSHYCNTKCQTNDWSQHRLVCKQTIISGLRPETTTTVAPIGPTGDSIVSLNSTKKISRTVVSSPTPLTSSPKVPRVTTPVQMSPQKSNDSPIVVPTQKSPKVSFIKTSVNDISNSTTVKRLDFNEGNKFKLISILDKLNGKSVKFIVTEQFDAEKSYYFSTIYDPSIGQVVQQLALDYPTKNKVSPKVDEVVVVKGSDDAYYRAYVLEVNKNSAQVLMIDDGFIEMVDSDNFYELEPKYLNIPAFSVLLVPDSEEAVLYLDLAVDKQDDFHCEGSYTLKDDNSYIQTDSIFIKLLKIDETVKFVKNPINKPKETQKSAEKSVVDYFQELSKRTLALDVEHQLMAVYKDETDPKNFFIAAEGGDFENVMVGCRGLGEKFDDKVKVNPNVGKTYLAKASDNDWYRAVVNSVNGDTVNVQYLDFGNKEDIESKYLMKLTSELKTSTVPPIAIKCKVDSTKLSDEHLNHKLDQAVDGAFLIKLKVIAINDSLHSVEVY